MKTLALIVVSLVVGVLNAAIVAKVMSSFWTWFIEYQYGPGPSMGAWFGASAMFCTGIRLAMSGIKQEPVDFGSVAKILLWEVGWLVGIGLTLLLTGMTGLIMGWVQ